MADREALRARIASLAAVALLAAISPCPANAYRPFDGTDASVAGHRLFELEMSPIAYARSGDERTLTAPQVTLNYGIGASFEVGLEGSSVMQMSPQAQDFSPALEEAGCSVKRILRRGTLQDHKGPSIATEESVEFPTQGQVHAGFGGSLIVSQPLSAAKTMMHFNASLERTQDQLTEQFAGVILDGPQNWPVRPIAELSWAREGTARATHGYLAGLIWQTRQGLTMDMAIKGLDGGPVHGLELRSGFTWHMQLHKRT